jgi:hypothetical protein
MDESLSDFKTSEKMIPFIQTFGKKFKFFNENREQIDASEEDHVSIG